jgi:ABC-type transport system involved in multi-copper enzyme maturation permease subunit
MNDSISTPTLDYTAEPIEAPGGVWTQTLALLVDAYRDLQARKLFWITLILSLLVSGVFAFVGIDPTGLTIFGKHLRGVPINSVIITPADFYKLAFTTFAIPLWLGFLATILALVSVGGIFPDMISSGSIDLYLSRPIGRLRLFLTKYAFGLLFTAVQVLLFSIVCFLIIGFRGGAWELGIFWAVPLVTMYFSCLYCVCVLVGIATRSTLAAILVTALFWGFLYVIHSTTVVLTTFSTAAEARVTQQQRLIKFNDDMISRNDALPPEQRGDMTAFKFQRDAQAATLGEYEQTARELGWWQTLVYSINAPLPKSAEMVQLMSRYLVRPGVREAIEQEDDRRREQFRAARGMPPASRPSQGNRGQSVRAFISPEVQQQVEEEIGVRDLPWIAGTSLGLEAVVLGMAAWVFCRRDF